MANLVDLETCFQEIELGLAQFTEIRAACYGHQNNMAMQDYSQIDGNTSLVGAYQRLLYGLQGFLQQLRALKESLLYVDLPDWQNQLRWDLLRSQKGENSIKDLQDKFDFLLDQFLRPRKVLYDLCSFLSFDAYQIPGLNENVATAQFDYLLENVNQMLRELISKSLIISKHPGFMLKTSCKVEVEVCFLAGKFLSEHQSFGGGQMTIRLIKETDARQLASGLISPGDLQPFGSLTNAKQQFPQDEDSNYVIRFEDTKLSSLDNRGRRENHVTMIADQRYALIIEITNCRVLDLGEIPIYCLSLPLAARVNVSQDCDNRGAILWRLAFGGLNWKEAYNPNQAIRLTEVIEMLAGYFSLYTEARPLDEQDLNYLHHKLWEFSNKTEVPTITFEQFARMNISPSPDTRFNFWEWFHSIMRLLQKGIPKYWNEGCCIGFISKDSAKNMLRARPGSLLLRFSDSTLGGVSLAFINEKGIFDNLTPMKIQDISKLTLTAAIRTYTDFRSCNHLIGKTATWTKEELFTLFADDIDRDEAAPVRGYTGTRLGLENARTSHDSSLPGSNGHHWSQMSPSEGPHSVMSSMNPQSLQSTSNSRTSSFSQAISPNRVSSLNGFPIGQDAQVIEPTNPFLDPVAQDFNMIDDGSAFGINQALPQEWVPVTNKYPVSNFPHNFNNHHANSM